MHFKEKKKRYRFVEKSATLEMALLDHENGENSLILNTPNRNEILKVGPPQHGECDVLGRGAYGTVLKAILGDNRVAVKIIKNRNNSNYQSMRNEAHILGWNHRNIVKILQVESTPFFGMVIMERIRGLCLQSVLDSIAVPLVHRSFICLDVLSALRYCHSRKILHLDVKPQNIFVSSRIWQDCQRNRRKSKRSYICKLCDFGSSLMYLEARQRSSTRLPRGTVRYMSPEALREMNLTPASDIYSYGITMWQMKNRRVPYHWIECNDAVTYRVVKQYLRPDSLECTENNSYDSTLLQHSNCTCCILSVGGSSPVKNSTRRSLNFTAVSNSNWSDEHRQKCPRHPCTEIACANSSEGSPTPASMEYGAALDVKALAILFDITHCANSCSRELSYENIYRSCWDSDPAHRPNAQDLQGQLESLLL